MILGKDMLLIFAMITVVTVVFFKPSGTEDHHYHLIATAESENWRIEQYKIEIQPKNIVSGSGRINPRSDNLVSDFFQIEIWLVSQSKEVTLWRKTLTGEIQVSGMEIGSIEGPILTEAGTYITFDDIDQVFAQITWNSIDGQTINERINLYEKE